MATLHGSVTPNSGLASVQFDLRHDDEVRLDDVRPAPDRCHADGDLGDDPGLKPGVTYHYRLVATTSVGTVEGADRTVTTLIAPKLSRLTLTPKAFKAGRGTKIGYVDTEAATTSFVVLHLVRHRHPCPCPVRAPGRRRDSVRFSGRGLKPGNYRLQATPKLGGLTGQTLSVTFTTVPGEGRAFGAALVQPVDRDGSEPGRSPPLD